MDSPSAWTPQGVAKKHRNAVLLLVVALALEVAAVPSLVTIVLTTTSTGALVAAVLGLAVASLLVGVAFIHYARSRMFATIAGVADGALRSTYTPPTAGPRGGGPSGAYGGARGGPGSSSSPWPDPTWESWPGHHQPYDHAHHHGSHDHGHHDHGGWSDAGSSSSDSGSSSSSDSGSSSSSSSD